MDLNQDSQGTVPINAPGGDSLMPDDQGQLGTGASTPTIATISTPAPLEEVPSAWSGVRTFVRETVETIALTLVIFLVIRAGVQNFRIEGQSMEPNFHDGQYLLVSKVDYMLGTPQRGDVVVFIAPTNQEKDFIKRVIGLPGETVEIHEGRILINGKELPQNYTVNTGTYTYGPVSVGPDELFVLGDNRNYSSDSHSWGMLPRKDLIGKAWVSYWPPHQWGVIQTPSFADGGDTARATTAAPPAASPQLPQPTTAAYPAN
jgi:signal peptidase I